MRILLTIALSWGVLTLAASGAHAHPLSPALLDVREAGDGTADVLWKTATVRLPGVDLQPALPTKCKPISDPTVEGAGASITVRWKVRCEPAGLVGEKIGIIDLAAAKIDALLRVKLADGRVMQEVLRGTEAFVTIPERINPFATFSSYLRLGVEHILWGADHLLFVFGLLLLVRTSRLLLGTITAFTLGHSVTLALAALELAVFPSGPIEVLIAFSVFLLATELARPETAGRQTLMRRFPWGIAFLFGLLHGLGFAGALKEVGLPSGDIPVALFSFNVGIELGQLMFVVGVVCLKWVWARVRLRTPDWVERVPVYTMGSMAAFWCFERMAALFVR